MDIYIYISGLIPSHKQADTHTHHTHPHKCKEKKNKMMM